MSNSLKDNEEKTENVFPIRKGIEHAANDTERKERRDKARWLAVAALKLSLNILRGIALCLMLWLRIPLKIVFGCVSIMAFMGVLLSWLIFNDLSMVPGFVTMGLGCTAAMVTYDYILSWLERANGASII